MDCTFYVAKIKMLVSCKVTAELLCVSLFSHIQKAGFLRIGLILFHACSSFKISQTLSQSMTNIMQVNV